MCGRITLTRLNLESIAAELDVADVRGYPLYQPHYNIAPSQQHPVLALQEFEGNRTRQICPMYWGFLSKRPGTGTPAMQINARAETLEARPMWREAFRKSRCAVITHGFFEWTGPKGVRRPLWFHRPDHGLILTAGLWEWHRVQGGHAIFGISGACQSHRASYEPRFSYEPRLTIRRQLGPRRGSGRSGSSSPVEKTL